MRATAGMCSPPGDGAVQNLQVEHLAGADVDVPTLGTESFLGRLGRQARSEPFQNSKFWLSLVPGTTSRNRASSSIVKCDVVTPCPIMLHAGRQGHTCNVQQRNALFSSPRKISRRSSGHLYIVGAWPFFFHNTPSLCR